MRAQLFWVKHSLLNGSGRQAVGSPPDVLRIVVRKKNELVCEIPELLGPIVVVLLAPGRFGGVVRLAVVSFSSLNFSSLSFSLLSFLFLSFLFSSLLFLRFSYLSFSSQFKKFSSHGHLRRTHSIK